MHKVFYGQDLRQGCLVHETLLQDQLLDALASLQGLLGDFVTVVVADERVEVSDDTDGVLDVCAADICISNASTRYSITCRDSA